MTSKYRIPCKLTYQAEVTVEAIGLKEAEEKFVAMHWLEDEELISILDWEPTGLPEVIDYGD